MIRPCPPLQSRILRVVLCLFLSGFTAAGLHAARDDERVARLNDQIKTLESVVNGTKNEGEKARLDTKLQRLRQELGILQERHAIEAQQRALADDLHTSPLDVLREKLRAVDRTVEEGEARVQGLSVRRKKAVAERDALSAQFEAGRGKAKANAERLTEIEEAVFTKNEELRSLALEREAAEGEIELAREADRLRTVLKAAEPNARPTLRGLFESYNRLRDQKKTDDQLGAIAGNLEQNFKVSQGSLELSQQKLAKFDEELSLLEKQTGFFSTDPLVERLLASQRSQKKALVERIPLIAAQIEAIRRAQIAVRTRQELILAETTFLEGQLVALKEAYQIRLRWPGAALGSLLALYLLGVYALLPLLYKNEGLFLARRLARYICVVAAAGVVAGFLFDDLSMVAATLGVVSAALVISLQDVCTCVFGWFVIMIGGKFSIGDRLEVDGTRGDVLDIELLRTTLLEINGWLATDQPTGRVITIPNNFIFKTKVFNFNHAHPYIWDKIDLTVTFATPVADAMALFTHVLTEETREQFAEAQTASGEMRRLYGIEDAVYTPKINTRIADSGVMFSLFYVAHYRQNASTRNRLNHRLIAELERNPAVQLAFTTLQLLHENAPPSPPADPRRPVPAVPVETLSPADKPRK